MYSFNRFRNLTAKEFSKKVLPFKRALPKKLYKDLLDYFLDDDIKESMPRITKEIKFNHLKKY